VFKSWFGRKPKRQRTEGPRLPVVFRGPAMVLTSEIETVTSAALQAAIQRRIPQLQFGDEPPKEADKIGDRPTALGYYPDFDRSRAIGNPMLVYGLSYIPNFNLEEVENESYVTSSWWWPERRDVLAQARAHAVAMVLGDIPATPPKERVLIEMQLVAAALDVLKTAIAVILPCSDAMWKPEDFLSELEEAEGDIPVSLVVPVKLGSDKDHQGTDGTPKLAARTDGLNAFGMMEVEWRAFEGDATDLYDSLGGIAEYLVTHGPIIADGDSIGGSAPGLVPNVVIRHEASTTVPGTQAYVVYPEPVN